MLEHYWFYIRQACTRLSYRGSGGPVRLNIYCQTDEPTLTFLYFLHRSKELRVNSWGTFDGTRQKKTYPTLLLLLPVLLLVVASVSVIDKWYVTSIRDGGSIWLSLKRNFMLARFHRFQHNPPSVADCL